jgi:AcrR family transcriptional regulator
MTPDDCRAGLSEARVRRNRAEAERAHAMCDLAEWVRRSEGVLTVAEMARLAGVARGTIYALLRSR